MERTRKVNRRTDGRTDGWMPRHYTTRLRRTHKNYRWSSCSSTLVDGPFFYQASRKYLNERFQSYGADMICDRQTDHSLLNKKKKQYMYASHVGGVGGGG